VILFQITGKMPPGEGAFLTFYGLTQSSAAVGVCGDLAEAVGGNCSPATRCAPASPPRPRHRRDRYQRRRDRFRINLTKAAGL
jgi:hypothetical protein